MLRSCYNLYKPGARNLRHPSKKNSLAFFVSLLFITKEEKEEDDETMQRSDGQWDGSAAADARD